ncbi:UBP2 Ubiquitin carboxyl-terminal hydrolase 2 [Candida maltosa Xu316]
MTVNNEEDSSSSSSFLHISNTGNDNTTDSDKSPISNQGSKSPENPPHQLQSNNPFRSSTVTASEEFISPSQLRTKIPNVELMKYPFKTLNRILDDLKWTVPVQEKYNFSLLNSKPLDYSDELSKVVNGSVVPFETLILNNDIDYSKSTEKVEYPDTQQVLYVIRGMLADSKQNVYHFRILALETNSNPFVTKFIDKHHYHVIPKTRVSPHDLKLLQEESTDTEKIIDDAFFKSLNSPNGQILRVSLFKPEFSTEDLVPLTDENIIRERYLSGIERHPGLSQETTPNPIHCIKTLIKVLKGPVTLKPLESIKTINLKNTVMDAQIDVNLLMDKLSFTLNGDEVVPPNLNNFPKLKESYIKKIVELIYIARKFKVANNEFQTVYSFSDNLSQYDKTNSMVNFTSNYSNRFPYFISLSASAYFPDELVIKCYELTVQSDPTNNLYYVDALKDVRHFKNNSSGNIYNNKLDTYFRQHELVGFSDYVEAMKIIGLVVENNDIDAIDDDVIIAMYRTQIKNDSKNYQYFNNNLRKISKIKNSEKLTDFIELELLPSNLALDELGIEEITEDDVVITAYEFKLDDLLQGNGFNAEASEIVLLNKALLSVAVYRKSYILLNYLETKLPEVVKIPAMDDITVLKAYELIGEDVNAKTPEDVLITVFQTQYVKETDVRLLRYALKLIAETKKSEILFSFLKNGKVDISLLPAENWPVGLDNIGNTCYLNSLLQYYFCIKPLRELILTFNEKNYNLSDYSDTRKIGGRKVEHLEVQRSYQFIYQLRRLFEEMIYSTKRCVQPSKELAYLSFLPLSQPVNFKEQEQKKQLPPPPPPPPLPAREEIKDDVVEVRLDDDDGDLVIEHRESVVAETDVTMVDENDVIVTDKEDEEEEEERGEIELETPDTSSDDSMSGDTKPKILPISTDQIESTIEVGRQQDVTECIENVIFQIETALPPESLDKDGEQNDLIKDLFYGKTKQIITPLDNSEKERVSVERFLSLIINISEKPKNLYDSLDGYFGETFLHLENGSVKKTVTIAQAPTILQFHVQRVLFDREKLMAYKSIEPIPFSESIYLDRYMDTTDPEILKKRNEIYEWKKVISELESEKAKLLNVDEDTNLNLLQNLQITKKFLQNKVVHDDSLDIELLTISVLDQQIEKLNAKLTEIEDKIKELQHSISVQFKDYTDIKYNIFAVFIHRGEANYGHYWVYIKDGDSFRKYNDEIVTQVPESEVYNFLDTNTATPYYIVYARDQDIINPLCRK